MSNNNIANVYIWLYFDTCVCLLLTTELNLPAELAIYAQFLLSEFQ